MRHLNFLSAVVLLMIFSSCSEEISDEVSFSKILDDNSYSNSYEPIGLVETQDGGAIIVSNVTDDPSEYPGITIIKVDEDGEWVQQLNTPDNYVFASGDIMEIDSVLYFVCMDRATFRANLAVVNQELTSIDFISLIGSSFPLAAAAINDEIVMLHYDAEDKQTVLSAFSTLGSLTNRVEYTIGEGSDADPVILNHYSQRKSRLPFEVGLSSSGSVYFNGLYNFSFSLVFSNFSDTPAGAILGQGINGGIQTLTPLDDGNYGLAGFQFEQNFIRPSVAVNETGISSSIDYLDRDLGELRANSIVSMVDYELNGSKYLVVASETESRQIAIYIYDQSTGGLINTQYIGFVNAFNLSQISISDDNSLWVLGSTFVGGKFERVFIEKISETQLQEVIN